MLKNLLFYTAISSLSVLGSQISKASNVSDLSETEEEDLPTLPNFNRPISCQDFYNIESSLRLPPTNSLLSMGKSLLSSEQSLKPSFITPDSLDKTDERFEKEKKNMLFYYKDGIEASNYQIDPKADIVLLMKHTSARNKFYVPTDRHSPRDNKRIFFLAGKFLPEEVEPDIIKDISIDKVNHLFSFKNSRGYNFEGKLDVFPLEAITINDVKKVYYAFTGNKWMCIEYGFPKSNGFQEVDFQLKLSIKKEDKVIWEGKSNKLETGRKFRQKKGGDKPANQIVSGENNHQIMKENSEILENFPPNINDLSSPNQNYNDSDIVQNSLNVPSITMSVDDSFKSPPVLSANSLGRLSKLSPKKNKVNPLAYIYQRPLLSLGDKPKNPSTNKGLNQQKIQDLNSTIEGESSVTSSSSIILSDTSDSAFLLNLPTDNAIPLSNFSLKKRLLEGQRIEPSLKKIRTSSEQNDKSQKFLLDQNKNYYLSYKDIQWTIPLQEKKDLFEFSIGDYDYKVTQSLKKGIRLCYKNNNTIQKSLLKLNQPLNIERLNKTHYFFFSDTKKDNR